MTDRLDEVAALYRSFSTVELTDLRRAFELDRLDEADPTFCDVRIALIDRELERRTVHAGQMYSRDSEHGPLTPVSAASTPDVWICRRVVDFPDGVPEGAAVAACTRCGAAIVFNPGRAVGAPKICMQCGGIEPLPIERLTRRRR